MALGAFLLGAGICVVSITNPPPAQAILGDVNGDGKVDIQDARAIANFLVGNSTSLPHPENADVNGDGKITTADALLILQFANGLRTSFGFQVPQVLAVMPANGATGVLLTSNVSVFFSAPISSTSLAGTLTLTDTTAGQLVAGTLHCSQDGVIETFFPAQPLQPAHTYKVDVTTAVVNTLGTHLGQPFFSTFQTQALGSLTLLSINNSTAAINSIQSIAVKALSSLNSPVSQVPILFAAQMGNGTFQPSGLRQITILTDGNGIAQTNFQLGGQAVGQTVIISATGFAPTPTFQVLSLPTQAVSLRIVSGNNQNCPVGVTISQPLVVKAMDEGGNAVQGTTVTFALTQGQGTFNGQPTAAVVTNSSGTANTFFTHGLASGTVLIQASFSGMVGQAPVFSLLGLTPQPSTPTAIVGTVINTNVQPLQGIKVFLASNPTINAITDAGGAFRLQPVPTGMQRFIIDSMNSGPINGVTYADLAFDLTVIQGNDNTTQMPAIVPPLDPLSFVDVSDVRGGTLTLRADPLWKLFLNPGQATFPNGMRAGRIFVTAVPTDKIPMPPPEGKIARTFVAIEPPLVRFSPPADVQFPNTDNLPAGTVTDIFSFDHTVGMFVSIGKGRVSEDGTVVRSLPGQGLIHGGWHLTPPPSPGPTTTAGGSGGGCTSEFFTCGMSTTIDPITGRFQLAGIPISCDPLGPIGIAGLPLGAVFPPGGPFRARVKCDTKEPPPPPGKKKVLCGKMITGQEAIIIQTDQGPKIIFLTKCLWKCPSGESVEVLPSENGFPSCPDKFEEVPE